MNTLFIYIGKHELSKCYYHELTDLLLFMIITDI